MIFGEAGTIKGYAKSWKEWKDEKSGTFLSFKNNIIIYLR